MSAHLAREDDVVERGMARDLQQPPLGDAVAPDRQRRERRAEVALADA